MSAKPINLLHHFHGPRMLRAPAAGATQKIAGLLIHCTSANDLHDGIFSVIYRFFFK